MCFFLGLKFVSSLVLVLRLGYMIRKLDTCRIRDALLLSGHLGCYFEWKFEWSIAAGNIEVVISFCFDNTR